MEPYKYSEFYNYYIKDQYGTKYIEIGFNNLNSTHPNTIINIPSKGYKVLDYQGEYIILEHPLGYRLKIESYLFFEIFKELTIKEGVIEDELIIIQKLNSTMLVKENSNILKEAKDYIIKKNINIDKKSISLGSKVTTLDGYTGYWLGEQRYITTDTYSKNKEKFPILSYRKKYIIYYPNKGIYPNSQDSFETYNEVQITNIKECDYTPFKNLKTNEDAINILNTLINSEITDDYLVYKDDPIYSSKLKSNNIISFVDKDFSFKNSIKYKKVLNESLIIKEPTYIDVPVCLTSNRYYTYYKGFYTENSFDKLTIDKNYVYIEKKKLVLYTSNYDTRVKLKNLREEFEILVIELPTKTFAVYIPGCYNL